MLLRKISKVFILAGLASSLLWAINPAKHIHKSDEATRTPPLNTSKKVEFTQKLAQKTLVYSNLTFYPRESEKGKQIENLQSLNKVTSSLPLNRLNSQEYAQDIKTLNLLFNEPNIPKAAIQAILTQELNLALRTQTHLQLDWGHAELHLLPLAHTPLFQANLTIDQLNRCIDFNHTNLSNLNLKGFDPSQKSFKNCNLSFSKNLDGLLLTKASSLQGVTLSGVNLSQFDPSKISLSGAVLAGSFNLDMKALSHCPDLTNSDLSGLDLTNFAPYKKNLTGIDFSHCKNLPVESMQNAISLQHCDLSFTDLNKFIPNGINLKGVNLTGCKNLNMGGLSRANSLEGVKFFGLDMTHFEPVGKNLKNACFSGSKNLTAQALATALNIEGINLSSSKVSEDELKKELKKNRKSLKVLSSISF